jgi:hypothetical protein
MSGYISLTNLEAQDLDERGMDVPEWGGKIKIRAKQTASATRFAPKRRGRDNCEERMQLLLFITGVVEPKFSEGTRGSLAQQSSGVFDRVLTEIDNVSHFM